eukprot:Skav235081  [mRNA]  locus=scaffold2106:57734:58549:- [translate_table: standard]
MKCRSCGVAVHSDRSPYCLPCSAIDTLAREFQGEFSSGTVRNLATDIVLAAARQVRAVRLYTLRQAGTPEGVTLREKPESAERPGGGAPREVREPKKGSGQPAEEEASYYTETEEDDRRRETEEDEVDSLDFPTAAEKAEVARRKEENPPGVAAKSAPPLRPPPKEVKQSHTRDHHHGERRRSRTRSREECKDRRRNRADPPEEASGSRRRSRGFELIPDKKKEPLAGPAGPPRQEGYLPERYFRLPSEEKPKPPRSSDQSKWQKKKGKRR